jgi:hypothetical protein
VERRTLVASTLSPAGDGVSDGAGAEAESVDDTGESRILPASLAPERED